MATHTIPEKKIDLPPTGSRNPDPITDASGRIPSRLASEPPWSGPPAGWPSARSRDRSPPLSERPSGAVAGGYAGKGVGELIDPTTEDDWLRDHFKSRPYVEEGDDFDDFHPAYRYGALAESKFGDAGINLMDQQLQSDWEASQESDMPWTKARAPSRTLTTAPSRSARIGRTPNSPSPYWKTEQTTVETRTRRLTDGYPVGRRVRVSK